MTLAWILFAFVGLFTARYMRDVWEPKQLLGTKAWFAVSIICKPKVDFHAIVSHKTFYVVVLGFFIQPI